MLNDKMHAPEEVACGLEVQGANAVTYSTEALMAPSAGWPAPDASGRPDPRTNPTLEALQIAVKTGDYSAIKLRLGALSWFDGVADEIKEVRTKLAESCEFVGGCHPTSEDNAKNAKIIDALIQLGELETRLHRVSKGLSGGEYELGLF